ncbi:hypothetical protein PS943_00950 [Pseudomonas fluorescens]|uniref:Uncharacterized protein n=1 Tax=Pseudomonas fluorescens TaxID=294 RepID=A0A5E7W0S2_PSEFL|nr:hypothetical protein [Pseudomonas fluorescens]VVQ28514.1 hypothetical protein PS943_00950 [Pseudomonas fluorescens]
MSSIEFYVPGDYDGPLTASGRGRTIAAFHLAQGDVEFLTKVTEMRRDVLNRLMSPSAVSYWIAQKWLEKARDVGRIQLLRLTAKGLVTCKNSVNGGGNVPTTAALVAQWRANMKRGGVSSFTLVSFDPISD